jgi:hypothetical protein
MFKGLASILLSMAIVFQGVIHAPPAHAAGCSKTGSQSGLLKHSGLVIGNTAKVCGRELWKLLPKPKIPTKPVVRKTPAKKVHWKNEFSVTPDQPRIKLGGSVDLTLGNSLVLSALAIPHTRNRMLLWYPAQVRFKPVSYLWNFGDGQTSTDRDVSHIWSQPGTFTVRLAVNYSVKYRITGKSAWVLLPGQIVANSLPAVVNVGQKSLKSSGLVSLVHWTCLQKPTAIGC